MKIKAIISYDGSFFFGFQRQTQKGKNRHITVESKFEDALKAVGIDSKILGSGRTDRGVHALGQVITFEAPDFWKDLSKLKKSLNRKFDTKIVIKDLFFVPENFHPRFSAKTRTYRYFIYTKNPSPFLSDYVCFKDTLDLKRCNSALNLFVGEHDFEYFRKTGSDENHTIREIKKAFAYRYKDFIVFNIEGDGFLRSQVRLIVAAVLEYAEGKIDLKIIEKELLKENKPIRKPAPHQGLYLSKIKY